MSPNIGTLNITMVTLDCTDPLVLGTWWATQTGGQVVENTEDGAFVVVRPGTGGPDLGFQISDAPTPGKNRMHLDLETDDRVTDVARLVDAGATEIEEHSMPGLRWTVLADPEGNHFCVAQADPTAS